jgi:ribonucleoside-diphosphate reductase alpha chain
MGIKFQPHIQKLLEDRYYLRDEEGNLLEHTPEEMFARVAVAVAKAESINDGVLLQKKYQKAFFELMADNKFLPNTPTLINAGKENTGSFSACFVIPVEDSMDSIFEAVKQSAMIFKAGGGIGYNFGRLREEGAIVKSTGQKSGGPLSFMKSFDAMCDTVKQGGSRRGAMMAVLPVWHPDIEKFIEMKADGVSFSNFNISVGITDDFMEGVKFNTEWALHSPLDIEAGQFSDGVVWVKARELMQKIVDQAHKTGDPGLVFLDTINKAHPLEEDIDATNPCGEIPLRPYESCIAKGELVLTDQGFLPIETIQKYDWVTSLDNGYPCYQQVSAVKNNGIKPVYKLLTKEGYKVKATEDHRFLTVDGWKQVKDLKENDELILGSQNFTANYKENFEDWELLGWMHGDGWFTENSVGISFNYADGDGPIKDRLLPYFIDWICDGNNVKPLRDDEVSFQLQTQLSCAKDALEEYGCKLCRASERELPSNIWFQPAEAQASFLRGYIAADGGVTGKANSQYKIASANRKMLEQVQLLLTRFGIGSWISTFSMENYENRNPQHQLVITGSDAQVLFNRIGFISPKKAEKFNTNPSMKYGKREIVRVASITLIGEEEVFDIEVVGTHNFIVNGLVAHNCNLGSINLMAYIDQCYYMDDVFSRAKDEFYIDYKKLAEDIPTMVRFLDDVIDVNPFPLPEIDKASKESRKIGLGIMGWADCLIKMKIPYDSQEALDLAEQLMGFIYNESLKASMDLSEEKGYYPLADNTRKYRRNATLLTVAPTGTLSRIAGVSSGIEPVFAWETQHKLVDLEYDEVHWAWTEFDNKREHTGIPFPPYMKTANEIPWEAHLKMQAAFQKHVDNSISKTINLPNDATANDVYDIYMEAWKSGLKGITVYRDGCKDNQPLNKIAETKIPYRETEDVKILRETLEDTVPKLAKDYTKVVEKEAARVFKKRGPVAVGVTHKVDTGRGKIYATVNYSEYHTSPVETFFRLGHLSTPMEASLAEWSGRLISLLLKYDVPLDDILRQGNKVYSDMSFWYNQNSFCSFPKLISHLLGYTFEEALDMAELDFDAFLENGNSFYEPVEEDGFCSAERLNDEYCYECGSYSIIGEGGCKVCQNCGYEKCG